MKLKNLSICLLAAGMLSFLTSGCETSKHNLKAKAKISEAQAREIAMSKVPDGKIKEGELEEEKGKLIWSFDIARPGTKNITEVNIDAMTGEVIAVDVETPSKEAAEAKAEKKEKDDEKEKK